MLYFLCIILGFFLGFGSFVFLQSIYRDPKNRECDNCDESGACANFYPGKKCGWWIQTEGEDK